jgi:hypothetical protein
MKMWSKNSRYLLDVEKSWMSWLNACWSEEYLGAIEVVIFNVDSAHTIRNTALVNGGVKPICSERAVDSDGAAVEVILYISETGEFGELEFNRLDTRPLRGIPKVRTASRQQSFSA